MCRGGGCILFVSSLYSCVFGVWPLHDCMSLEYGHQSDPEMEKVQQEVGASRSLFLSSQAALAPNGVILRSGSSFADFSVAENLDASGLMMGQTKPPEVLLLRADT